MDGSSLIKIYHDIPYKTDPELKEKVLKEMREHRRGLVVFRWLIFIVMVVIPLGIVILGVVSPFVAAITLFYSVVQPVYKWLKTTGKLKKSPRELEKEKEELLMRHHHYHCERNPEGFLKLKIENFESALRADVRKDAEALKNKKIN